MKTFANSPFLRIAHKSLACLLAFCIVNMPVWALNANNAAVSAGAANITNPASNTVSVDLISNRAVLDWSQMNAASNEILNFTGSSGFAVLNRVASAVDFNGALNGAGGHIFVVSPHGVLIGPDASITATSFTASTLNITNSDFMNSIYRFSGDGIGQVANYGDISAQQVALIGKKVLNAGTISSPGGYTILAAGDSVYLNPEGSNVVIEVAGVTIPEEPTTDGLGDVINEGTIEAIDGQIILAAGDTYSRAIEGLSDMSVAVESGTGRVGQFGTLNANGSDGKGGSITLTAADAVVLGETSVTTANANTMGRGGNVIVYSPNSAIFRNGALVEAKGGIEGGNGGFFELSGQQYVETLGNINLSATIGNDGLFLLDPYNITIVPGTGNDLVASGNVWEPSGDSSTLGILTLEELLGTANVRLSTIGSTGMGSENGDIIFAADRYLSSGIDPVTGNPASNTLYVDALNDIIFMEGNGIYFEGDGHLELYAALGGVTSVDRGKKPNIWTQRGDIVIETGAGGIDLGVLQTGTPSLSGEIRPGEIRLTTTDGGDITVQHLNVDGKGYGSVYVLSSGDLTINGQTSFGGAVKVKTVTTSDNEDALSFICLIADGDTTINGDVFAEAHGNRESITGVWIGAGTNVREQGGYEGTVTVNGKIQADASSPGSEFQKSDASIRVFAKNIFLNGSKDPDAQAQNYTYQSETTGYNDSPDAIYVDEDGNPIQNPDPYTDTLSTGARALVIIDNTKDGSCLDCANKIRVVLPIAIDDFWNNAKEIAVVIEVLINDEDGLGGFLVNGDVFLDDITSTNGGTLTINPDGTVSYTPPADWVDNFDATGTYTDTFEYYAVDSDGDVSKDPALVTITLTNQLPTGIGGFATTPKEVDVDITEATSDGILIQFEIGQDPDGDPVWISDYDFSGEVDINLTNQLPTGIGGFATTPKEVDVDITEATSDGILIQFEIGQDPDGDPVWISDYDFSGEGDLTPITDNDGHIIGFTYDPSTADLSGASFDDTGFAAAFESFTYTVTDGYNESTVDFAGEVDINLTNQLPVANPDQYTGSHNVLLDVSEAENGTIKGIEPEFADTDADPGDLLSAILVDDVDFGTLIFNSNGSFTYKPNPGNTTGSDSFSYKVSDGYNESNTATVTINLTNREPIAQPDEYGTGPDQPLTITPPLDLITGVDPADNGDFDLDNNGDEYNPDTNPNGWVFKDILNAFLPGGQSSGTTALGGTIVLNPDGSFTYTPPAGVEGENDSFTYFVTDSYDNSKTVLVTIAIGELPPPPPPSIPAAPLPLLEIPQLKGCPAVMDAAATELAVNSDELQLLIGNSMATNPNLQPCTACENLLEAASALKGINPEVIAALNEVFKLAPAEAPFTPEALASIQTAIANFRDMEPQLAIMSAEQYEQYQQYMLADEVIEAFVSYVAVLDNDLKLPVGDAMALVTDKYFEPIEASGNPNIGAYIIQRIQASQSAGEPVVASAD